MMEFKYPTQETEFRKHEMVIQLLSIYPRDGVINDIFIYIYI